MKKSYKGFWLWVASYCAGFLPVININADGSTITRLTLLYTGVMMAVLMLIIKKADRIYWINGVSFEDAEKANYEQRMDYADKHLQKFAGFAVVYAIFTLVGHIMKWSIIIDTVVFTVGLIAAAFSTINVKME